MDDMSFEDQSVQLYGAFNDQMGGMEMPTSSKDAPDLCLIETFPTYVIVCLDGKYFQVNYTNTGGEIAFDSPDKWTEVEQNDEWVAKAGKAVKYPVKAKVPATPQDDEDMLVSFGDAIKVIGETEQGIKIGGHLVRFGDPEHVDKSEFRDFFNSKTKYGLTPGQRKSVPIYFNHAMPMETKDGQQIVIDEEIGEGEIWLEDTGVLIEAILYNRAEYERAIAGHVKSLGWSSGALGHVVKRVQQPNGSHWIKRWVIGEGSITPMPAEPTNNVMQLKSVKNVMPLNLSDLQSETNPPKGEAEVALGKDTQSEGAASLATKSESEPKPEKKIMEISKEELEEMTTKAAEAGADKAVKAFIAAQPPTNDGGHVVVTLDEADRPFKSLAENAKAVKEYAVSMGQKEHPRLKFLKAAAGASEGSPSDGGVLLDPTLTAEIITPIHDEGAFSKDVRILPVSSNSNYGWINGIDETSRATGSRWGGIQGYRLAEAASITSSKPKFRRIQWELKKYACVVYGTDELLADAAQFSAVVNIGCREELMFMLNDDIMNGTGAAGCQGFMNSGALIAVTRDTASAIKGTDISAMWQRMSPRSKANAKWYINSECAPQLDALFAVGSTAVLFPYAGYTADGVRTLYGRPIVETEFNAALNTSGDIALCDMSQYLMWEKAGVEAATSIHLQFLTDETTFRFIYRSDGKSSLASPLTPYKGSLTHSPFVVLGSASA